MTVMEPRPDSRYAQGDAVAIWERVEGVKDVVKRQPGGRLLAGAGNAVKWRRRPAPS